MKACKYFGLHTSPFEGQPNPCFFCATAAHAETSATLQYAVHAGKVCTLVLGDSGSGKTLLGHVLARNAPAGTAVLWVHGIGQPDGRTEALVCPRGVAERSDSSALASIEKTELSQWIRASLPKSRPLLVLIDNADGLHEQGWEDLLSLVTRELCTPQRLSIVLFGIPALAETLAAPALVRLQRRVFRACRLSPLTCAEVHTYVQHRLRVAGSDGHEIFRPAALDLIHRLTDGNPALVNQLCDNALVDAFGDERTQIDAHDVLATVQAITAGMRCGLDQPSPVEGWRARPLLQGPSESCRVRAAAASSPKTSGLLRAMGAADRPHSIHPAATTRWRTVDSRLAEILSQMPETRARPRRLGIVPAISSLEPSAAR